MVNYKIVAGVLMICISLLIGSCKTDSKEQRNEGRESIEISREANDSTFVDKTREKDADFVVDAVAANYAEIKLAQLAHNKSVNNDLKAIASKFEEENLRLLNELKAYANKRGIAVPLEESSGDAKDLAKLNDTSIDKFDKEWCDEMEQLHQRYINRFETRVNHTQDAELRQLITASLPAVKSHLVMLKQYAANVF